MAGKKKVTDEGLNKTARKNQHKSKKEGFIAAAPEHLNRIIPCGGGTYAYVLDPRDGKTWHVSVRGAAWNVLIGDLMETSFGPQIDAEIKALGL